MSLILLSLSSEAPPPEPITATIPLNIKPPPTTPNFHNTDNMGNKVAASFGVIMAIFIVLALTFWTFSAFKHSRHNTAKHNNAHHFKLDDWIRRRNTDRAAAATADIEMQVLVLPRVPERARTRPGPARVSRMDRVGRSAPAPAPATTADRVEFCDVPLSPPPRAPRGAAAPAGFF